jgi:Uncharacterized protein conserved in bacteria
MFELLKSAFAGDQEARTQIQLIVAPHAVTIDFSAMILVQEKLVVTYDTGRIKTLNSPPQGTDRMQVADIYHCDKNGAAWTSIPIPFNFPISKMLYENGLFIFISDSDQQVGGTISQIKKAMFEVSFAADGVTKADIKRCFYSIPCTIPEPSQQRTVQQNPPVKDSVIGLLSFNEQMQNFQANCNVNGKDFTLSIAVNDRSKVLDLLPILRNRFDQLEEMDSVAKNFAAEELIRLKNDSWLEPHEKAVTKQSFKTSMSVNHISFTPSGELEMYYDEGGLFWGHSIVVFVDKHGQPKKADICG